MFCTNAITKLGSCARLTDEHSAQAGDTLRTNGRLADVLHATPPHNKREKVLNGAGGFRPKWKHSRGRCKNLATTVPLAAMVGVTPRVPRLLGALREARAQEYPSKRVLCREAEVRLADPQRSHLCLRLPWEVDSRFIRGIRKVSSTEYASPKRPANVCEGFSRDPTETGPAEKGKG